MKTYFDCVPCFISQSLEAARMVSDDEQVHLKVLREVMRFLETVSFNNPPPRVSMDVHRIIREITGSRDPYKKVKDQANRMGENFFPVLKKMVKNSESPLLIAVKLAIAGNVIDFGTTTRFNVKEVVNKVMKHEHVNEEVYSRFVKTLAEADRVLYLGDNAGEVFFDKLLLEELFSMGKHVVYVVRKNPVINDVTYEDAVFAGIDRVAEVIKGDTGDVSAPGLLLEFASPVLMKHLRSADMIIAKGQGNYETLSDIKREVFFLLMVKCPLVARDLGVETGKMMLGVKQ